MDPQVVTRHHRTRTIALAAHESARQVFGGIEPGCELLCLTHGQFSLTDALATLLDVTGPADVVISTWSAARVDLAHAHKFLADGRIRSLRFIVDRSFATRQPDYCRALVELFGDEAIRTTVSHAKFAVVTNERWTLAIRTSMNLNENRRLEIIEVSDDAALAAFLLAVTATVFASVEPGDLNNYAMPDAPEDRFRPQHRSEREEVAAIMARRHVRTQSAGPAATGDPSRS